MIKKNTQKGFTIIELMIATSVFAVVLAIAASGVVTIGRLYYKGLTSSKAQETSRSVTETIARTIQFSGDSLATGGSFPNAQSFCFGQDRYTYIINSQVTDSTTIGLRHDIRPDLNDCSPIESDNPAGTELLPNHLRLLDFRISSVSPDSFRIAIKVIYGDDDLISTYDNDGNPVGGSGHPTAVESNGAQCKPGIAGSNFCASSELETIVNKRVK